MGLPLSSVTVTSVSTTRVLLQDRNLRVEGRGRARGLGSAGMAM
jgi:hypothetical protein